MDDDYDPCRRYGYGRDRYYIDEAGSPVYDEGERRGEEPLYGWDEDDDDDDDI